MGGRVPSSLHGLQKYYTKEFNPCIHNKGPGLDITKDSQEPGKGRDVPAGESPPWTGTNSPTHREKTGSPYWRCRLMLSHGMYNIINRISELKMLLL